MKDIISRVKGTHDLLDMRLYDAVLSIIYRHLSHYNFAHIITPLLEPLELFNRSLGLHTDVISKEMFVIESHGDEKERICLRPEGTASVVRSYLENHILHEPWKVFLSGSMFRYEQPQKGRFREFNQVSIEIVAASSIMYDVELIVLLDRLFDQQLQLNNYILLLNFIGCPNDRSRYINQLTIFVTPLTGSLCDHCKKRKEKNLLRIFDCKNDSCQMLYAEAPKITSYLCSDCNAEWEQLKLNLHIMGVGYQEDPNLVRGLDYYSKTVFEFSSASLGSQSAFCGGGRYDGLAEQLGSSKIVPSLGAAIGIERLLLLVTAQQQISINSKQLAATLPLSKEQLSLALLIADVLRAEGIAADAILDITSVKSMMRLANKLNATWAILIGDEEQQTQTVTVKWMHNAHQERIAQTKLATVLKDKVT